MEEKKNKRTSDASREKHGMKKNLQGKKTRSDISFVPVSSSTDQLLDDVVVVGKSCLLTKSKSHESGYKLHECRSETSLCQQLKDVGPSEGQLLGSFSNVSFVSAKTEFSSYDVLQKKIHELEEALENKTMTEQILKKQVSDDQAIDTCSVSTETDADFGDVKAYESKLKDIQRKMTSKERKIKDLLMKLEECNKDREAEVEKNRTMAHEVNHLNRQLQSMYELVSKKNWNKSADSAELVRLKTKTVEMENIIQKQEEDKREMRKKLEKLSSRLEVKETEVSVKTRELAEFKNKSTLEMCKLINQIDSLKMEATKQAQLIDSKISDAQNAMDDEIVGITQRLEDRYQQDLKSAVEKLRLNFENLSQLPESAIERLLQLCEPSQIDFLSVQKEWDKQQMLLESKIISMQTDHKRELTHLRDSYESKVLLLKTQIDSLTSQLNERKKIIDIFESELTLYKSNSSMTLLRASSQADDLTSLKELYSAEIRSQKQIHKLEMNVFEEKVKTLSEEILYRAKNEEIQHQELEYARKLALTFREKYEQLVLEWEGRVEKEFQVSLTEKVDTNKPELDTVFEEFRNVINSLKEAEIVHEKRLKTLQLSHADEISSYRRDIEIFKSKLQQLEVFQNTQMKLDETIQELINSIGANYNKTMEALLTSHVTELNLKQLEEYSTKKRHSEEINSLKENQSKEMAELQGKVKTLEEANYKMEKELSSLRSGCYCKDAKALKAKAEEVSLELLKYEGMLAIKDETEEILKARIKELEDLIKVKEENCKMELEELVAKFIQVNVLSSAKDDLARELEDKLNDSEKFLEKSCCELDRLYELCVSLAGNIKNMGATVVSGKGDSEETEDLPAAYSAVKIKIEKLKNCFLETFEKIDFLEDTKKSLKLSEEIKSDEMEYLRKSMNSALQRCQILENEKKLLLDENDKLKVEVKDLSKDVTEKEELVANTASIPAEKEAEMKEKLEILETERSELIERERLVSAERDEIQERNEELEENMRILNERMDFLVAELTNNRGPEREETYSFSMQEVRVTYKEEVERETSTVGCQVSLPVSEYSEVLRYTEQYEVLSKMNEALKSENENLKREITEDDGDSRFSLQEVVSRCKDLENELSELINERQNYITMFENLRRERDCLKEEVENLRKAGEGDHIGRRREKEGLEEEAALKEKKIKELKKEMGRLSDCIRALTVKLEQMKASNENLMSESTEQLKHNQKLINELEEAWSQRYEIEDQLAKVRRENAFLNIHRNQLQETNQRITNMVAEGKPSVVSWIKIHETVENIVDEVLALKSSLSDSASTSSCSVGFEIPKTKSDMKLLTETLHAQLKNKTILCDELLVQKNALERELEELENLLKKNDSRIFSQTKLCDNRFKSREFDVRKRQLSKNQLERRASMHANQQSHGSDELTSSSLMNLNRLKKHLEYQVDLEEAQFRESLESEINNLREEMLKLKDGIKGDSLGGGIVKEEKRQRSSLVEEAYEEEVAELTKEFEREVEKLREVFVRESENGKCEENQEKYATEIDNLKLYFEKKWEELKKRYQNIYSSQNQARLNLALDKERSQILSRFQTLYQEEESKKSAQMVEKFLDEVLNRYIEEIKFLHDTHKDVLTNLETKHSAEVQRLHLIIYQMQESFENAVRKRERREGEEGWNDVETVRAEYEGKLEEEKKKLNDLLEAEKQKHEKEMLEVEEFWTEKLSECETKCAIMKATTKEKKMEEKRGVKEEEKSKEQNQSDDGQKSCTSEKVNKIEENSYSKSVHHNQLSGLKLEESKLSEDSFCTSCLSNQTYFGKMEVKTDDDKLEIVRERDALKETVLSLRHILTKILIFFGQRGKDLNNSTLREFDNEETLYKSILMDFDRSASDLTTASNNLLFAMDVSSIIQEINDNSLLNSSDQVRFELDRCLKQLKKDATGLLALSQPEAPGHLLELVRKIEKEKNDLEDKVKKVEEAHNEIKKEIKTTKERLSLWERNLEVVSEGYGEQVTEPKNIISLSELKDRLKLFVSEHCVQPSQEVNLLEEIYKEEGDRLQEDWKKEKFDLQQQIDAADKQLHSLRKFLEEQAVEREQEREMFDKEISNLQECLKAKERDSSLHNRTNREVGHPALGSTESPVEALEAQVKELNGRLSDSERNRKSVESEFQNAVKKIWSLREVIQDLEVQLAEVSEKESNMKKAVDKFEALVDDQSGIIRHLKDELEECKNQREAKYVDQIKKLEEELMGLRQLAEQVNPESLTQMKASLRDIEAILIKKTKDLECMHVSSANVSCSSPSEDVSIRDHLDVTRCSTPDEMSMGNQPHSLILPLEEFDRIHEKLVRHTRAEEAAMKCIQDLKMQLRNNRKAFEEVQTERDVLLEKVDGFLKENSSLKVRLEEQRCNAGLLQKQLNADLESQISRLEIDVDKLNDLCSQKDKQLRDMQVILENTTKALKVRETEAMNRSKEENSLVTALKTELASALNEKEKLEESVEQMKERLREKVSMPALMESMIEEKNAEIDRLEKEVLRLTTERSSASLPSANPPKHGKRLRFSEPDSFGEYVSSISVQNPSTLRNFSDSCNDMKNSSFKLRQHFQSFTSKPESISSIGPLQLSPRGKDFCSSWKTSSPIPIVAQEEDDRNEDKNSEAEDQESKLQSVIQSKQQEISELQLEIDKLSRQLVEAKEELESIRTQSKEKENEVASKEEEIRRLQSSEKSLLMTIETLKESHSEEVEDLHNKLRFEHGKVKKVYEEIKALEVKKIEIEEAFLGLKNDYNEKLAGEQKMVEALIEQIKDLEVKNAESTEKMAAIKKEMEMRVKDSIEESEKLTKEISDLKHENENLKEMYLKSSSKTTIDAQVQAEVEEECSKCQSNLALALEVTKVEDNLYPLKDNMNRVKREVDKMVEGICENGFDKDEVLSCLTSLRLLLSSLVNSVDELYREVEAHRKKVMEYSVDDLAVKVQKELLLSAKLDNKLLSSIEANGFVPNDQQTEMFDSVGGGGDNVCMMPQPPEMNENMIKVINMYKELEKKVTELESEREDLEAKAVEQQRIIKLLEECLSKEKERILEEKERCCEDAKIMELLRVNLEKGLEDLKAKEKDLKRERQQRLALEREIESLKKSSDESDGGLNCQLESQKEKVMSLNKVLEEEKKKNQELRLLYEQNKIERISERGAQKLMESELTLIREQKENLKEELINARKLIHSRNVEIGLLKRKISLLEIDIKALSFSNECQEPETSTTRSESLEGSFNPKSPSFLLKMKKLNSCVQRHVQESNSMGEAYLHLSQETEQMRDLIKKLDVSTEGQQQDNTLIPDLDVEQKLWSLERGKLILDVDALKGENKAVKEESAETYKKNELLKLENSRMKSEIQALKKEISNQIESGLLKERVSLLMNKYSRAESYRKALAWQKQYLLIMLSGYQRSEEEACRKLGRLGHKKKESKGKGRHCGRFKAVALAVIAVLRMKFIMKRWQRSRMTSVSSLRALQAQSENHKQNLASVLNIYNEPINPLSYQTQNIMRRSSASKVLRTPPSRDPGLGKYSLDSKAVPEILETFTYLSDKTGTAKVLP